VSVAEYNMELHSLTEEFRGHKLQRVGRAIFIPTASALTRLSVSNLSLLNIDMESRSASESAFDALSGAVVKDESGAEHRLVKVEVLDSGQAIARMGNGLLARLWHLQGGYDRTELDRRLRALTVDAGRLQALVLLPNSYLNLTESIWGYTLAEPKNHTSLAQLISWDGESDYRDWLFQISPRARMAIGSVLADRAHSLSSLGIYRSGWDPNWVLTQVEQNRLSLKVADIENLCAGGRTHLYKSGDPRLLPPELFLGQRQPDALSDAYSLAVVLYLLLCGVHPFGANEAWSDTTGLFTGLSVAVPLGDARPRPGCTLTSQLRDMFYRCFNDGRFFRTHRPSAADWQEACLSAADKTYLCAKCGRASLPYSRTADGARIVCFSCGAPQPELGALLFFDATADGAGKLERYLHRCLPDRALVVDAGGKTVLERHVEPNAPPPQKLKGLAMVSSERDCVVLKNLADQPFLLSSADSGRPKKILPGVTFRLKFGSLVYFGQPVKGSIVRGAEIVRMTEIQI
jgi:hypothetical protein